MKKAIFITCPVQNGREYSNPWKNKTYNCRELELTRGDGLLTVMRKFDAKNVVSAKLRITSLGIFEALINGKRVGGDGVYDELMPLWTDYRHRVFEIEYDITKQIKKNGENRLTVRVSPGWWAGRISFGWYGSKPCALCAEIELEYRDGGSELIASDESWKTAMAGPVMTADIWDGEYFDARVPDPAVDESACEWQNAVRFDGFEGEIVPFSGERVAVNSYLAPQSATVWRGTLKNGCDLGKIRAVKRTVGDNCEHIVLRAGQHLTLDFGQNMVGRPSLALLAADGTAVTCLFAEMLNDTGDSSRGNDGPQGSVYIKNYRSALSRLYYIASSGGNRKRLNIFRPLHTFYGFRYIEITADRDIEVVCITGEVVGSVLHGAGSFECSDAEVNRLYSNIEWGMRGNYLSIPTDCPQRDERLGWTCDTQVFCGTGAYIADTLGFMRKWLCDMRDSQIGFEGAYCSVAPRVFPSHNADAVWSDAGLIVTYKMWQMYGDREIVSDNYSAMEDYMKYLERYGLEGPNTTYGDWLNYEVTDKRYIAVCVYAYDALLMRKFSEVLGLTDKAEYYEALRRKIINYYFEKYVADGEITQKTQTGYLLPLAYEIIDGELREKTVSALAGKIRDNNFTLSTGFVGTGILNQTLAEVGLDKLAYSLLLNTSDPSWLYSVRQGATTVWERWNSYTLENGFGNVGMNSFNHYAYGAVAEWMYAYVAGIRPDENEPGFGHFILGPRPDSRSDDEIPDGQHKITMASAVYHGISSRWEYENGELVWRFTIPDGSARIEFPLLNGRKTVELNGIVFSCGELGGVIRENTMIFELEAGNYTAK